MVTAGNRTKWANCTKLDYVSAAGTSTCPYPSSDVVAEALYTRATLLSSGAQFFATALFVWVLKRDSFLEGLSIFGLVS
jgi:hypothetical protein